MKAFTHTALCGLARLAPLTASTVAMKTRRIRWITGLALAVSQTVSAAPVTDTVIIGSQEWAQVDLFTNVSWNTLNTQCPGGVCSLASSVNGYDLAGWTWASNQEVQTLFDGFTGETSPAPSLLAIQNSAWAPALLALFDPNSIDPSVETVNGWSATPSNVTDGFVPYVSDGLLPTIHDFAVTQLTQDKSFSHAAIGAWITRSASQTPVPATLTLFGLGLASLGVFRRKHVAKV